MRVLAAVLAVLCLLFGLLLLGPASGDHGSSRTLRAPLPTSEPVDERLLGTHGPKLLEAGATLLPPSAPPQSTVTRLRGEVRNRTKDAPMPEVPVRLTLPDQTVSGARSHEDGRFELDYDGPPGARLEALAPRGYVAVPAHVELSQAQLDGEAELVLWLERGTSAPVVGRVHERDSGQGLWQVSVELTQEGSALRETVTTDDLGLFESVRAFPAGLLRARVVDGAPEGPVALGTFRREHLEQRKVGPPWELAVAVGPTYFLVPGRGGAFAPGTLARLVEERPRSIAAALKVTREGFELLDPPEVPSLPRPEPRRAGDAARTIELDDDVEVAWPTLSLRPGPIAWVRYPAPLSAPAGDYAARLVVQSTSERGSVPVPSTSGRHDDPLLVPLSAVARVEGRTVEASGTPVGDVHVRFFENGDPSGLPRTVVVTAADGTFAVANLPVGSYRVELAPAACPGAVRNVSLEPGWNTIPGLVLDAAREGGTVAGRLVLPEGPGLSFPLPTLRARDGSRYTAHAKMMRRRRRGDDEKELQFEFPGVPHGEYDLFVGAALGAEASPAHWSPGSIRLTPPARGLTFRPRPFEFEDQVFVRALGPGGEHVGQGTLWFEPPGYLLGSTAVRTVRLDARGRPEQATFHLPPEAELSWRFWSPGYRSARGGEHDLVRLDDGRRELLIAVEAGWTGVLHLRQRAGAGPIRRDPGQAMEDSYPVAGAKIYVDGRRVGRSDSEGRVTLDLASAPTRIEVSLEGWAAERLLSNLPGERAGDAAGVLLLRRAKAGRSR